MKKIFVTLILFPLIFTQLCFSKEFTLKWEKEDNSVRYILEIAKDKEFTQILYQYETFSNSKTLDLPIGSYYMRVHGLDRNNKKRCFDD